MGSKGRPLQLVKLKLDEDGTGKVEVDDEALEFLQSRLKTIGTQKVAIVSVMGAFRTGKSFLLDLFLRFLRYEEQEAAAASSNPKPAPPRGSGETFPLPAWVTSAGNTIAGATDEDTEGDAGGFRFRGGMDACTEGIWVWSEPFKRTINGKIVALLLMDTQGAWDSNMTKEQSATIFGLTAVLSSKQIYNINMQIQEDKVENLAYFMRFAQAAIRKAAADLKGSNTEQSFGEADVERPFQTLDFLVRDWRHFRENWDVDQCKTQMAEHFAKHVNPKKTVQNETVEALHSMFHRIGCFCLPHPGLTIERETWTGNVNDISEDFIRFIDLYVRDVFTEGLDTKRILGAELSTITFPMVLRDFVQAFEGAAPAAMSFTQAMTSATVLLAKEQAMKSYAKKMDDIAARAPRGMDEKLFEDTNRSISQEISNEFQRMTIFGSDMTRSEAWTAIEDNLRTLHSRYLEDNRRRLDSCLVSFANIALLALSLFILDRVSDWTCDWWSKTCADASRLMLTAYIGIGIFIGIHAYRLFRDRGQLAVAMATGELWKEMLRLLGVYGELARTLNIHEIPKLTAQMKATWNNKLNNNVPESNKKQD